MVKNSALYSYRVHDIAVHDLRIVVIAVMEDEETSWSKDIHQLREVLEDVLHVLDDVD